MTSKQFRKARVEAKVFHRGDAFEWFKKDCQTFDSLAANLHSLLMPSPA